MNVSPTDERVADALRWLSEQGPVRGADALLAGACTEVAEVAPNVGHDGHDGRRSGFRTPVAVAAAVLLVIVVVVGGRRLARPVERVAADRGPSPTAVAAEPGTTAQPDGCLIASACALPDPLTDFEVRSLPEGWSQRKRTISGTPAEGAIEHEYVAPVKDVPGPGGTMAARYLTVRLLVGGQDRASFDSSRAVRTPLPGGRTALVGDGSRTFAGVTLPSSIVLVDFDDRRFLVAEGEGISADIVLAAVSSVVVR